MRSREVIGAIAKVTFREILRDKVLYNILVCAGLLMAVSFLGSRLMLTRQDRVVIDFGLSAVNLSCSMLAILIGAGLLGRELERRTFFVALSRPISRLQFVVGKFTGLALILALNWLLLSAAFFLIYFAVLPSGEPMGLSTLVWALVLLLFQSGLLGGLAILFSAFSTTALSAIITIGLYLIGNNISQLRLVADRTQSGPMQAALNVAASVLPNLEHFNLGTKAVYHLGVPLTFSAISFFYAVTWVALSLLGASFLVRWKEG